MSEDEGQGSTPGQPDASRPSTAAARRQRRASARHGAAASPAPATSSTDEDAVAKKSSLTEKKGRATPARAVTKVEKPSLPQRVMRFLREVVAELRKVIWPTRKQMVTYTTVVLAFLVVMTAFVYGLDVGFTKLVFLIFA